MTRASARRLAADERGAAAIEYALLGALLAGGLIATVASLGPSVRDLFGKADAELAEEIEAGK